MRRICAVVCACVFLSLSSFADEGLWLFNAAPKQKIKTRYGFELTEPWLEHVRLSSVRFTNGGSGSFVSADGLAFTNHHVGADCLQKLSTAQRDYLATGFYAATPADEPQCPDLELNVLTGIEDVTVKVQSAAKPGMSSAEVSSAQRAVMASLEAQCAKTAATRCDVVNLYSGGMYHLYRYRRYTDVRLVFAPEYAAAFFGGDPDNFEFPRYDLDVCFFRVYDEGKPVKLDHYLKWSTAGTKEGDLVFLSGHPGSTSRLNTVAQLEFLRDVQYPYQLKSNQRRTKLLFEFSAKSPENARIAQRQIYGLQNSYKGTRGYYNALLKQDLMRNKHAAEDKLRAELAGAGNPWAEIERAVRIQREIYIPYMLIERLNGFRSDLAEKARDLVRAAAERAKPNTERLKEYRESALPTLQQKLFSTAPIYEALEIVTLSDSLAEMRDLLGADHPVVKRALAGRTPEQAASELIGKTRLKDVEFRRKLYEGGRDAITQSDDPLIVLMRDIDADARNLGTRNEDEVQTPIRQAGATIAKGLFQARGLDAYPDATFTLRLSYGTVAGYIEDGQGQLPKGTKIAPFTTIGAAFDIAARHGNKDPYSLPQSWLAARRKLALKAPLNLAATTDSIGGSSGSPMVDRKGELVGINFDRNAQGLGRNFFYTEEGGRNVAVDSRGILELIRNAYRAQALAEELTHGSRDNKASR